MTVESPLIHLSPEKGKTPNNNSLLFRLHNPTLTFSGPKFAKFYYTHFSRTFLGLLQLNSQNAS